MNLMIKFNLSQGQINAYVREGNELDSDYITIRENSSYRTIGRQIGSGAEGSIFLVTYYGQEIVIKIFSNSDPLKKTPTPEKVAKLHELLKAKLPKNVLGPCGLVESGGDVCGYWMQYAGKGAILFSAFIADTMNYSISDFLRMFQQLGETITELHSMGIRIVDVNPQGMMLAPDSNVKLIDTDSFYIDGIPSEVYTPDYVHPDLLGKDIRNCTILPGYDIHSLLCILFQIIYRANPWDGFVPGFKTPEKMAKAKIWVFDARVKKAPDTLKPLEILTDDMIEVFKAFILQGYLGSWPHKVIEECANSMIFCSTCKVQYTSERQKCPACTTNNSKYRKISNGWKAIEESSVKSNSKEVIRVTGKIIDLKLLTTQLLV